MPPRSTLTESGSETAARAARASGVRALAAPVRKINHLMSAIWVVGFKSSMDKAKMSAIAKEIKHAAEEIGRRVRKRYKE